MRHLDYIQEQTELLSNISHIMKSKTPSSAAYTPIIVLPAGIFVETAKKVFELGVYLGYNIKSSSSLQELMVGEEVVSLASSIEDLKSRINNLENKIDALNSGVFSIKESIAVLDAQYKNIDKKIGEIDKRIEKVDEKIEKVNQRLSSWIDWVLRYIIPPIISALISLLVSKT